jgi:hypothetical protein
MMTLGVPLSRESLDAQRVVSRIRTNPFSLSSIGVVSLGRGDGTFTTPVQSSFVGYVMNTTDLNGDGRRDVIAGTLQL